MNIELSQIDYAALSPLLITLSGALLVLLLETFSDSLSKQYSFYVTLMVLLAATHATVYAPISHHILLTPWLRFDEISRVFSVIFLVIGVCSALLAYPFFKRYDVTCGEYYFLLLSSVFGLILIGSAADFLTLFLGLETLSIASYILCSYMKSWKLSHEAAIKYFLIGAIAAAFLLYGFALIYGAIGSTNFEQLVARYHTIPQDGAGQVLFLSGVALVTLGLAFKAAIVPFHVWAPDVYDGAPTPVTAFMAVGTKAGAFAAFAVVFLVAMPQLNFMWKEALAILAFPTLIYANYVAMKQVQLRRFFAYSGISHAGFMLIPLAVGTAAAIPALIFYLIVYSFATLGSFAVLTFIDDKSEGVMMNDLKGLFKRSPWLAGILSLCLLTLAGIPPTIGFFAKFYLFRLAFEAGYYALIIVALLTTILAAYYYLKIIGIMLMRTPADEAIERSSVYKTWPVILLGSASALALIALSFYPAPLLNLLSF